VVANVISVAPHVVVSRGQEIGPILWNHNFFYFVPNNLSLDPVWNSWVQYKSSYSISVNFILISYFHSCQDLKRDQFPSIFVVETLYAFMISHMLAICSAHLIVFTWMILNMFLLFSLIENYWNIFYKYRSLRVYLRLSEVRDDAGSREESWNDVVKGKADILKL
jgi:hypothetical protein